MYTVHIRETAGRPWLGAVCAAAALGLTMLAAWQLAGHRHGDVKVGPKVRLPGWPIVFAVPQGFNSGKDAVSPRPDESLLCDEQTFEHEDKSGRTTSITVLFRTYPRLTTPDQAIPRMLNDFYGGSRRRAHGLDDDDGSDHVGHPISLGPYDGEMTGFVTDRGKSNGMIAAALRPNGRAYGVIVQTSGGAEAGGVAILQAVCDSIEPVRKEK